MNESREKFDIDGEKLEDGQQVVLVHEEPGGYMAPVLLLKIVDLQPHTPMVKVEVVQRLVHKDAALFTIGETFEALTWHLSRSFATMAVATDE